MIPVPGTINHKAFCFVMFFELLHGVPKQKAKQKLSGETCVTALRLLRVGAPWISEQETISQEVTAPQRFRITLLNLSRLTVHMEKTPIIRDILYGTSLETQGRFFLMPVKAWCSMCKRTTLEVVSMGPSSESQLYLYSCSSPGHLVIYSH